MSDSEEWIDAEVVEEADKSEKSINVNKKDPAKEIKFKTGTDLQKDVPADISRDHVDAQGNKEQNTTIDEKKIAGEHPAEEESSDYKSQAVNETENEKDEILEVETIVDLGLAKREKERGNVLFRTKTFDRALAAYSSALSCTPPEEEALKSALFANKAACYLHLELWEDVVRECDDCLRIDDEYVKALLRRAKAYEMLEKYQEAVGDWKKILEKDSKNKRAIFALRRLEPLAKEQFEKQKKEVMGQLKTMGDSVLGWFGMSTDDFQMVQDPKTGSYSVNVNKKS